MAGFMEVPIKLDVKIKEFIEIAYNSAVDEIGEFEYVYIENKFDQKLNILSSEHKAWVKQLFKYYQALNKVKMQWENSKIKITNLTARAIGAALFYFINPYDIIPDFTPEIGYADDYYVMILCLKLISEKDREKIFNRLKKVG